MNARRTTIAELAVGDEVIAATAGGYDEPPAVLHGRVVELEQVLNSPVGTFRFVTLETAGGQRLREDLWDHDPIFLVTEPSPAQLPPPGTSSGEPPPSPRS